MEETPQSISAPLFDLLEHSVEHVQMKLANQQGFSAIMYSLHSGEKRASIYQLDSVEDALEQCSKDLTSVLHDADAYAITYDASIRRNDGSEVPVMLTQIEERGMDEAQLIAICYQQVRQNDTFEINTVGSYFSAGGCKIKRLAN